MEGLKPPKCLNLDGNLCENWKKWIQHFKIFHVASGNDKKTPEVQVAIFLHVIGEEALEIYNTFDLTDEEKNSLEKVIAAFENYCMPKTNESVDRHIFFTRTQHISESFDEFVTSLKKLSSTCGFGDLKDSLIRDRIISGISDKRLKDRLLREDNLTLEKCIKMGKTNELAEVQLKSLNDESSIDAVKTNNRKKSEKGQAFVPQRKFENKTENRNKKYVGKSCNRCGKSHKKFNCPAFNKICHNCNKKGHFSKMCYNKNVNFVKNFDDLYSVHSNNSDYDNFVLSSISTHKFNNCNDWYEKLVVNNSQILVAKLDTGAQCNVLPLTEFKQLGLKRNCLKNTNVNLCNYNGSKMKVIGKCVLKCKTVKGIEANILFQIVETAPGTTSVLGLPTLTALNLVQRVDRIESKNNNFQNIMDSYTDLFTGIGDLKNFIYNIKLKEDAVGKIEPCRKIPINLLKPLKEELMRMEEMNVIKKIEEPTEFVNSLVVVKKSNGSLRVCLDPQHLNKQILREHYYLPTFEEIASRMPGAQVFSILDANKAFWQIKLSEESAKLTTFNTPFGRFCFLRMPYGICSAPEVFHRAFSELFKDTNGVEIYIDDILVWGKNKQEHDRRLKAVLDKARECNIKFNKEKCKIALPEVTYLGHRFSRDGIKPDEDKVRAVVEMKPPTNVKELETFLGMITYVSRFIPNVSEKTSVLRDMLRKNTLWNWSSIHDKAFDEIKQILSRKPILQFFNAGNEVTLSVDASQSGLGAVILQNGLPVAYASRALTDTQKNYAQIEKETLAIVFGCEKFHQYLYGRTFTIESDHKPLEAIFKKPLNKCPLRLQRMRIRLQPYSFNLVYKPGKELLIADALSRSYVEDSDEFFKGEIEAHVGMIVESLPVSGEIMKKFQIETEKDEVLQLVLKFVKNGWPKTKTQVPDVVKPYFYFREELSEAKGILFKNSLIVVPKSLKKEMLNKIHYTHLGIEKCKHRARELLFWPGMARDIEDLIKNCTTCLSFQNANMKEPLLPKDIPNSPWQVLGADIFHFRGKEYLLVVDYFSKYVEVELLEDTTSKNVVNVLKAMFSRFGIPQTVFSDNGPQFNSKSFREFSKQWNFSHKTSSPLYPQSNGMAERHIQTIKKLLKKSLHDNKDMYLTILEYKNVPISNELESPAEIMFGRKIRGMKYQINSSS